MTARGAAFVALVVLIGLGAVAGWLVGVPLAAIGVLAFLALAISARRTIVRPKGAQTPEKAPPR